MRENQLNRYVPLTGWIIVILTLLCIPSKIISYGYLPADDTLRHAAKAVSGKPWQEILVMRSDFKIDPHPGWHATLGAVHRCLNCGAETLVLISITGLMLLVSCPCMAIPRTICPPAIRCFRRLPLGSSTGHRTSPFRRRSANGPVRNRRSALEGFFLDQLRSAGSFILFGLSRRAGNCPKHS